MLSIQIKAAVGQLHGKAAEMLSDVFGDITAEQLLGSNGMRRVGINGILVNERRVVGAKRTERHAHQMREFGKQMGVERLAMSMQPHEDMRHALWYMQIE